MPAADRADSVAKRWSGLATDGSSAAAISVSAKGMLKSTCSSVTAAISVSRSMSRRMSTPLVMMHRGFR